MKPWLSRLGLVIVLCGALAPAGAGEAKVGGAALPNPRPPLSAGQAGQAKPHAGATASQSPVAALTPQAPATVIPPSLDRTDLLLIRIAIALTTGLGFLVSVAPMVAYVDRGWSWRAHIISCSLGTEAKDAYLELIMQQASDLKTADKRFFDYYRRWYGRSRLVIPTVLFAVIVGAYAYLLAIFAAQRLFSATSFAFSNSLTLVAAAAMAGAYANVSLDALARVTRRDLGPEDIYGMSLRLFVAVPVGYAFASLANDDLAPFIAFAIGAFPLQQTAGMLRRLLAKQIGDTLPADAQSDILTKLSGVDVAVADRIASIGVTTVTQLAYSDTIQLTMRTNMNFNFVLDLVSQALAFVYLDDKLPILRPMGLRGAFELYVLSLETRDPKNPQYENSSTVMTQAATAIGLTTEQFKNTLHEIADDPYTAFLAKAYGS